MVERVACGEGCTARACLKRTRRRTLGCEPAEGGERLRLFETLLFQVPTSACSRALSVAPHGGSVFGTAFLSGATFSRPGRWNGRDLGVPCDLDPARRLTHRLASSMICVRKLPPSSCQQALRDFISGTPKSSWCSCDATPGRDRGLHQIDDLATLLRGRGCHGVRNFPLNRVCSVESLRHLSWKRQLVLVNGWISEPDTATKKSSKTPLTIMSPAAIFADRTESSLETTTLRQSASL